MTREEATTARLEGIRKRCAQHHAAPILCICAGSELDGVGGKMGNLVLWLPSEIANLGVDEIKALLRGTLQELSQ